MINFNVSFDNPWYLLLLIPAIFLTIFPYFRLSKKYRFTRNRISSMTLHLIILMLSIFLLAGLVFSYNVSNYENEVIVLVDLSDSNDENRTLKDQFVLDIINEADDVFKLGIVTFGYNQVYASQLSYDKDNTYQQYLNAELPNTTATDIDAALTYTRELFSEDSSAKIVLVSDGIETDGSVESVIGSIALDGIQVDTKYFSNSYASNEVQIIDCTLPDYNVVVGDECEIELTVQSSFAGDAVINIYDNNELTDYADVKLSEGILSINVSHQFTLPGLHELSFEIVSGQDTLMENNQYYSYMYLAIFDKILIIENGDEGGYLQNILSNDFDVELISIDEVASYDLTNVDNLREYDQVVLLNIANEDIQDRAPGLDIALNQYVYVYGGGMLTAGGDINEAETSAYNRDDLIGTLYQNMLPVSAIDYTPPLGVVLVIDRSGSMSSTDSSTGKSYLDLAKDAAYAALEHLTERDYCAIVSLETSYSVDNSMVSATKKYEIQDSIDLLEVGGSTYFAPALTRASQLLKSTDVEKKHIILISDGAPTDDSETILDTCESIAASGITISTFTMGDSITSIMQEIANVGMGDREEAGAYYMENATSVSTSLAIDLNVDEIEEIVYETFQVESGDYSQILDGIDDEDLPTLDGYYGVKAKSGSTTVLTGPYVPIYTYWDYGEGTVGSFMCDLSGYWSSDFLSDATGLRILNNIIYSLFPTEDISANEISVSINQENYSNTASIFTPLEEGQSIKLEITSPSTDVSVGGEIREYYGSSSSGFSRISFSIEQAGIHNIVIYKLDAEGNVIATYETQYAFSYSQEYNTFLNEEEDGSTLAGLSEESNGKQITFASDVYEQLITNYVKDFDPRILFMITVIVLFLLDIAVRKFKFKWPHELVRDYKEKKLEENK